jgi:hypothetical protein
MTEKKTYRIDVFQFDKGNSGFREPCGFIYRHGQLETIDVPVASGSATPRMESREALVVKAAGATRVLYPIAAPTVECGVGFMLNLTASDRMPSGLYRNLYRECATCNGKGHVLHVLAD